MKIKLFFIFLLFLRTGLLYPMNNGVVLSHDCQDKKETGYAQSFMAAGALIGGILMYDYYTGNCGCQCGTYGVASGLAWGMGALMFRMPSSKKTIQLSFLDIVKWVEHTPLCFTGSSFAQFDRNKNSLYKILHSKLDSEQKSSLNSYKTLRSILSTGELYGRLKAHGLVTDVISLIHTQATKDLQKELHDIVISLSAHELRQLLELYGEITKMKAGGFQKDKNKWTQASAFMGQKEFSNVLTNAYAKLLHPESFD